MGVEITDKCKAIVNKTVKAFGEISTLPEVTVKIMDVVDNPKSTAVELYEVIKHDPSLSARVLKVINSAFYGLPGQVANVDRAIRLLGISAIKNIAVAASVGGMFAGKQLPELFDAKELWRHSVAVGVAAKRIASLTGTVAAQDEMFLGGLIHDIGLLMEWQAFPDELAEITRRCEAGEGAFVQLEEQAIGATHQNFGYALTKKWKFPSQLQAAVGFHHNPEALQGELRAVGMVLHCADTLCCQEGLGFDLLARDQELTEELLNTVGITTDQLDEVRDELGSQVSEAERLLSPNG